MKKTFVYLAMSSCFILGTSIAHADSHSSQGNMHDQMFKDMDTNSDGMVSRDESKAYGEKKFQKMDANGDGQISSEEMKAAHKQMMGGEHKKMDDSGKDHKGKAHSDSKGNDWNQKSADTQSGDASQSDHH